MAVNDRVTTITKAINNLRWHSLFARIPGMLSIKKNAHKQNARKYYQLFEFDFQQLHKKYIGDRVTRDESRLCRELSATFDKELKMCPICEIVILSNFLHKTATFTHVAQTTHYLCFRIGFLS